MPSGNMRTSRCSNVMLRKKCPACDRPVPARRSLCPDRWECGHCRAVLEWVESPRRLAGLVVASISAVTFLSLKQLHRYIWIPAEAGLLIFVALCTVTVYPILMLTNKLRICPGVHVCTCGYDLAGNISGQCPECGRAIMEAESNIQRDAE